MAEYFRAVWKARYFWVHLAFSDVRSRWRRSFLGLFWSALQPLGITALLSVILSKLFHMQIAEYAPYILSGIIVWDYIVSNVMGGSLAFVQADAYIKQCKHPLAIYTLRISLGSLVFLMVASITLYAWCAVVFPENIGWPWIATLTIFPILLFIAWPMATILAYFGARFRDLPHAMALVMQALWFVSPVYFASSMFRSGGLGILVDYNPVFHVLQLFRAPLLQGLSPTPEDYLYAVATACVFALLAAYLGWRLERRVIFYL